MSFWNGKRVWITGGSGFLGQVLVRSLRAHGCEQVFPTGIEDGDLTQLVDVRKFLREIRPDIVVHLATERYDKPDPVNLGSGMEISIKDLTETIARQVGFKGEIRWDKSKPNGQPRRRLDVSRAEKEFGFRAQMGFEEGLKRTVEWYRQARSTSRK